MKIKNTVITVISALGLTSGFMSFGANSSSNVFDKNRLYTLTNKAYESVSLKQMDIFQAKKAEGLSISELKKLDINDFNLPNKDFIAYKVVNLSIGENGTVISNENGDGFSLKKGDILRVNSINNSDLPVNENFNIGYVKNDTYTTTTCGSIISPTTAWEVLEDSDAGDYKIYIKAENAKSNNNSFDVIITVER